MLEVNTALQNSRCRAEHCILDVLNLYSMLYLCLRKITLTRRSISIIYRIIISLFHDNTYYVG